MTSPPYSTQAVLYYAPGGGLGHVRRAQKMARTLGFARNWVLATASPYACAPWVDDSVRIEKIPEALSGNSVALRAWMVATLDRLQPSVLYVDAFPGGLFGELCSLPVPASTECVHVARLLDWKRYLSRLEGPLPRYAKVLVLEAVHSDHARALAAITSSMEPLDLGEVCTVAAPKATDTLPVWLVVHSEPLEEVLGLIAYAREAARVERVEPRFVVITAAVTHVPGVECLRLVDARDWYTRAHRIFTAAGFNTLLETRAWRNIQHIMPMPRALDDQFERARRSRQL